MEMTCSGRKTEILSKEVEFYGEKMDYIYCIVKGLDPDKNTFKFTVKIGNYTQTIQTTIEQPSILLKPKQAKVVSAGSVIVAAETNVDEDEKNVGFEWRRTDWDDSFASNSGQAYVFEGIMEGYIRNLYTGAFWKYRPYYLSDSGKYYYGDWISFDPTNMSYFEPTVHTYSTVETDGNTALVKGYVLPGSDDILQQGFMYWEETENSKAHKIKGNNVQIVEVAGRLMETKLENLKYGTNYRYQAFVTTKEGTSTGEVRTFTTEGTSNTAIDEIFVNEDMNTNAPERYYYDINGRSVDKIQHGFFIIKSKGKVRKTFVP